VHGIKLKLTTVHDTPGSSPGGSINLIRSFAFACGIKRNWLKLAA